MTMNKKTSKVVLASLIVSSAVGLTACGNTSNSANSSSNVNSPSNATAASTSKKPVTIQFWYGLGGKLGKNMQTLIDEFNASQKDVIVQGVAQANYTETTQKLQAAMAAHNVPAAVLLSSENPTWVNKGLFAPLDSFIANDPNFNKSDFIPAFIQQGQFNGKQYFLPMYGTTQVLYYRKDMLQKAGITPDQLNTWESLANAAQKMTINEGGQTKVYGWEPMYGPDNLIDASLSAGGTILSSDGKTVTIDSKQWVNTWEQFRKWLHQDKTMTVHHGGQGWAYWYATIGDVLNGQAAGYTGSSGDQGDLKFDVVAAHEQPGWANSPAKPIAQAQVGAIPSEAPKEQQEAAFKWLEFFMNAKNTAWWSMQTGYIPVRSSAKEDPTYQTYLQSHPQAAVPLAQALHASSAFIDPTGGKIYDALIKAADAVELQNVPASDALLQAKKDAQAALDQVVGK